MERTIKLHFINGLLILMLFGCQDSFAKNSLYRHVDGEPDTYALYDSEEFGGSTLNNFYAFEGDPSNSNPYFMPNDAAIPDEEPADEGQNFNEEENAEPEEFYYLEYVDPGLDEWAVSTMWVSNDIAQRAIA